MNKKTLFVIGFFVIGITLAAFGLFGATTQARGANTPADWSGSWQMGPNFDATLIGCVAGNGIARITAAYYPELDRVYFLGARCEDNNTYGSVFYFDPVDGTYHDTLVDMQTPVSNYQVVRIDDDGNGNGPGLYIVGGRTQSGVQSSAVQVYYPDDNTVATIATDPFPPAVPYSPGGVVSVADKIYVFGGFDGTAVNAFTYIYDSAAAAGSRWTLTACNLPTPRSYIASVGLNGKIYAMGGDDYTGGTLVPLNDTVVLDTADLGSCWQDGLMADLPAVNGDATGVYVDENYIGGGIFVIGGNFSTIGRLVYRYDVAGDLWESFPDLVIPAPATGRRNQAAVYIPAVGERVPALWTFGGYDGSGTNAMTDSSEVYSNILLQPDAWEVLGVPGSTAEDTFTQINLIGGDEHTYDLSVTSDVTWTVNLPATVGPIASGATGSFDLAVDIPDSVLGGETGSFTVTSTAQDDPGLTASATITVRTVVGVLGTVTDADTGMPIENAYVWIQDSEDGLGEYHDAYTDADGNYLMSDVPLGDYYFGASAIYHQPSFYPDGWPDGALTFTLLPTAPSVIDVELVASMIDWDPQAITVNVLPGSTTHETLTIQNDGAGPYY